MKLTHKPGGEYGIDYGVVVVFLLWIVATIVLLTMLAIRSLQEKRIYLDFNATTPIASEVVAAINQALIEPFGAFTATWHEFPQYRCGTLI
jgi:hypothetical protein